MHRCLSKAPDVPKLNLTCQNHKRIFDIAPALCEIAVVEVVRLRNSHILMKIEMWVAIWGALTGTFATAYNLSQWFLDRARLKVEGKIDVVHTTRIDVVLTISAVNIGRRPVSVKSVAAFLSNEPANIQTPIGLSPQQRAEFLNTAQRFLVSSELVLFGSRAELPVVLKPDGGQEVWKCSLPKGVKFLTYKKGDEENGRACVQLTSGKKVFCDFLLLSDDQWPPL